MHSKNTEENKMKFHIKGIYCLVLLTELEFGLTSNILLQKKKKKLGRGDVELTSSLNSYLQILIFLFRHSFKTRMYCIC